MADVCPDFLRDVARSRGIIILPSLRRVGRLHERPSDLSYRQDEWFGVMMESVQSGGPATPKEHWGALQTTWERRSLMAANWLREASVVADAGCGLMALEKMLPSSTVYIPMDVVSRDARTIVFDLNTEPIPVVACDAMVMLGVLEYSDDVASVLPQLHRFPKVLFSYNHVSINDALWRLGLRTKNVTWRNRHTRTALRRMLAVAGLRIVREQRIRVGERLYEVSGKSPS